MQPFSTAVFNSKLLTEFKLKSARLALVSQLAQFAEGATKGAAMPTRNRRGGGSIFGAIESDAETFAPAANQFETVSGACRHGRN